MSPQSVVIAVAAVGVVVMAIHASVSGTTRFVETGDSYPGAFTAILAPSGFYVTLLLVAIVFGGLAFVAVAARPDKDNVIGVEVYRVHRLISRLAPIWLVLAVLMVLVTAADRAGTPAGTLVGQAHLWSFIDASEQAVAWIVSACCALVITLVTRLSLRWTAHALCLIPAAIAVVALPVAGNAGQGPNHDFTTTAVIVFATAVSALTGLRIAAAITLGRDTPAADRLQTWQRVVVISLALDVAALVYGAILLVFLVPAGSLMTTAYGRWSIVAALALVIGTVIDTVLVRAVRRSAAIPGSAMSLLLGGVAAAVTTQVALAAMATRTAPALLQHEFTTWDVFLGYRLPHPPSVLRLAFDWRLDLFLGVGAIVLAVGYLIGVRQLKGTGIEWPWTRTAAWIGGCASLLIVTSSGVRTYGMAMFSVHMAEHMALNMFVPVLLVLGAPVTLALRALPTAGAGGLPGPREWIVWLVHSRFTRFISNPAVAFLMFVLSLYAVYFTALFDTLARYHWGHDLMSVHFLLTGYVFYWIIIGIDPGPKRLPFLARLGLLFAIMPFHAFFGIATMTMSSLIGGTFYQYLRLPWLADLHSDQFLGGAIAWGASEVPALLVVIALVSQWATSDRRSARRADRHADAYNDELSSYNQMLAELSKHRS
ncbi:cytochrome c oxidase assembly protein [Gordonia sp. NPDC003424]